MTRRHHLTRSAAVLTAIAFAAPALATSPAQASSAIPAAVPAAPNPAQATAAIAALNSASSAAGDLIGTVAYRGAEQPYVVGDLAGAAGRFGSTSPQAKSAAGVVASNANALAHLLCGGSATRQKLLRASLLARDRAEVAYAATVVAAHRAGVSGTTPRQKEALAGVTTASEVLAATIHPTVPTVKTAVIAKALSLQDGRDESALKAAALDRPTQFTAVEVDSLDSARLAVALGQEQLGTPAASSPAVEYRAALEAVFTEHVYQTGLFGEAVLVKGPTSTAAAAAHEADGLNTRLVASLLCHIGTGPDTQSIWNRHITGYSDYLTHLSTGGSSVTKADQLFDSYEAAITAELHRAVPTLASATLRATFTMHVTGTLTVFRLAKSGDPAVYPTAAIGANMFAGFAATIAEHQTTLHAMKPMVNSILG